LNITSPFGYGEIVPFLKNQKVLLPKAGEIPEFCWAVNAVPVSFAEFAQVSRDYPIVFTSGDNGESFAPVAVLGMQSAENLFIEPGSVPPRWVQGVYLPAYVRRYPFCMARVTREAVEQKERLICVEKRHLDDAGELLFDGEGTASSRWQEIERLLQEYEVDLERTREMCGILSDYGLMEPFTMQANMNQGGAMHMTGMYRVDEKKLEFLNAAQHKVLIKKRVMGRIYLHLAALEGFGRLLDRKAQRVRAA
jgi:hypothetical protein